MSQYKDAEIGETVYFWFAANLTTGAAGDGATPLYDVRLAGAAAGAIPTASGTPTLLTHANYTDGLHEIAIDTTGYAAGEYAVFCTLTISSVNPGGFVGSFKVVAVGDSLHSAAARVMDAIPNATAGAAGGLFIAGSNAATSITTALTANITGNLSGSVGSVSGAVGSVTGAVGSVTGSVGSVTGAVGSVTGAVGSVTAGVTVTTNNDKTGYSLTQAFPANFADMNISVTTGLVRPDMANASGNYAGTVATVTTLTNAPTGMALESTLTTIASYIDTEITTIINTLGTAGAGLTGVPWNAAWDAEVQSECTDALTAWGKTGFSLAAAGLDPVLIESGIVAGAGLTDDAGTQLTAINMRQALSACLSALAAVLSGAATTTVGIKPAALPAGNTRISATVDADGNRSAVTLKVPT